MNAEKKQRDGDDDADFEEFHPLLPHRRKATATIYREFAENKAKDKKINLEAGSSDSNDEDVTHKRAHTVKVEGQHEQKKVKQEVDGGGEVEVTDLQDVKPFRLQPMDKYELLMKEFITHLDVAFNYRSQARAGSIAVMQMLREEMRDGIIPIDSLSNVVRSLMFVRKTGQTLDETWSCPEGKLASQTRRRVMICIISMAKRNIFDDFAESKMDETDEQPLIPRWLTNKVGKDKEDFIIPPHVESTVNYLEVSKSSRVGSENRDKVLNRGYPLRSEAGFYVCKFLYSNLKGMYTETRKNARMNFFKKVGYLFMDWNAHKECTVRDSAVHLGWVAPLGHHIDDMIRVKHVPRTSQFVGKKKAVKSKKVEAWDGLYNNNEVDNIWAGHGNGARYIEFGRTAKDVTLLAEHDVVLCKKKEENVVRRRSGKERKTWRRAINLMDIATRLIEDCCGYLPKHPAFDVLRAHKYSIPLIYCVARTIRVILSTRKTRKIADLESDFPPATEDSCEEGLGDNELDRSEYADIPKESDYGSESTEEAAPRITQESDDGEGSQEAVEGGEVELSGEEVHGNGEGDKDEGAENGHSNEGQDQCAFLSVDEGERSPTKECSVAENEGRDEESSTQEQEKDVISGDQAASSTLVDERADSLYPYKMDEVEDAIRLFFDTMLSNDVETGHNLKQATCTVTAQQYWAEHIGNGLENEPTEMYGHVKMGTENDMFESDEKEGDGESEKGKYDEDFGM